MKCPKCEGEMKEGFVGDQTTDLSLVAKQRWGTKVGPLGGVLGVIENSCEIKTYRCKDCGYLESYAK